MLDSVVVELGEGWCTWVSEEGDEMPDGTIQEGQGGCGWRVGVGGAEEDCCEDVRVRGVEGVGFDIWVLEGGEEELREFWGASDLGVEEGGCGFEEDGVFGGDW